MQFREKVYAYNMSNVDLWKECFFSIKAINGSLLIYLRNNAFSTMTRGLYTAYEVFKNCSEQENGDI